MVTVYVKTEGQEAVMNVISSMAARGTNTRPLMGIIGHIILSSVTKNFEEEGRPKWKPISGLTQAIYTGSLISRLTATKSYQNIKRSKTKVARTSAYLTKHGSRKVLQGEGDLKKSIVIGKISNSQVEIGSSLVYARIHQLGGTIVPKKAKWLLIPFGPGQYLRLKKVVIPARPYLLLRDEDGTAIMRATQDYLLQAKDRAASGGKP